MIGDNHHQCVVEGTTLTQLVKEDAQLFILRGYFGVVHAIQQRLVFGGQRAAQW